MSGKAAAEAFYKLRGFPATGKAARTPPSGARCLPAQAPMNSRRPNHAV